MVQTFKRLNKQTLSSVSRETMMGDLEGEKNRNCCPIVNNEIIFSQLTSVLLAGSKRQLQLSDLIELPEDIKSSNNKDFFVDYGAELTNEKNTFVEGKEYSAMVHLLWTTHGFSFVRLGFLTLVNTILSFCGPIMVNSVVRFIQSHPNVNDSKHGLLLLGSLSIILLLSTVFNIRFNLRSNLLQTQLRAGLTRLVFSNAITMRNYERKQAEGESFDESKILNLVQVDVDRAAGVVSSLHNLWSLPLQIVVAFALLYWQVKLAFLAGVVLILILLPLNTAVANRIGVATKDLMTRKDLRMKLISEALGSMTAIKLCGWEDIIAALSNKKREEELVFLKQQKYLDAVCVFLWASLPVLVPFATFTTTVLMGESLNAVQVFTTIALLNMLIFPMNALPWIVNGVMESRVSLKRIGRLLSAVDQDPQESGSTEIRRYLHLNTTRSEWSQDLYSGSVLNPSWTATLLPAHYCAAHARDVGHEGFVLGPLGADAFAVRPGQFVGVAGRVGSGKSSLLQAILKEMVPMTSVPLRKNQFENDGLVFSYCPQLPVIHSGTVFSNIVFGSTYNKSRYLEVIEGCGLKEDIAHWELSDMHDVGVGGSKLSGGQRLRIGVARALYAYTDVVLLDDCFSALDGNTANHLRQFIKSICDGTAIASESRPYLVSLASSSSLKRRAVVVATHAVEQLEQADFMLELTQGKETYRGSFGEWKETLGTNDNDEALRLSQRLQAKLEEDEQRRSITGHKETGVVTSGGEGVGEVQEEGRAVGRIHNDVYRAYLGAMGSCLVWTVFVSTAVMQFSNNGLSMYLAYWAELHEDEETESRASDKQFLLIMGLIVAVNVVATSVRSYSFALAGLRAAESIYFQLVDSVFHTRQQFFDKTPKGQLVNRFGKDSNTIDDQLPFIANIALAQSFMLLGCSLTIIYSCPFMIVVLVFVFYAYNDIQKFYRESSRELRRLESLYRSPVYSLLTECVQDGVALRALHGVAMLHSETMFEKALDESLRVSWNAALASQWMSARMQFLGNSITIVLVFVCILIVMYQLFPLPAGLAGLAVLFSMNIVNNLSGTINSFVETEQSMVSVERVHEYITTLPNEFGSDAPPVTGSDTSAHFQEDPGTDIERGEDPLTAGLLAEAEETPISYKPENRMEITNRSSVGSLFSFMDQRSTSTVGHRLDYLSSIEWPRSGSIEFEHVYLRYETPALASDHAMRMTDSYYALKDVSVQIASGTRIAVVGRTGSGKSSIMNVLLRLYPYEEHLGTVLIDDEPLHSIPKRLLRQAVVAIPQSVVVFSDTLRFNLDPLSEYSDTQVVWALWRSGLLYNLTQQEGDSPAVPLEKALDRTSVLEWRLTVDGTGSAPGESQKDVTLSLGQRQLLCMSRLFLRFSPDELEARKRSQTIPVKCIVLDEVTANMDYATRLLLRSSVKELLRELTGKEAASPPTLLMICHKLDDAADLCDHVMHMDAGALQYYGPMEAFAASSISDSS